jgi:hypothetical protein
MNEYRPLTEQVLEEVSSREFVLNWKDVSLPLLIRDEGLSMVYKRAEESFKNGDFGEAAACLIYAFELAKSMAKLSIFGAGLISQRIKIREGLARDKVVVDYLTCLDEEIEAFKLGLNYMDLRNYLDMANVVGINSIFYQLPPDAPDETVIAGFKKKLQEASVDPEQLKEWYVKVTDAVLKFIVRSESNSRFLLDQFKKLTKSTLRD